MEKCDDDDDDNDRYMSVKCEETHHCVSANVVISVIMLKMREASMFRFTCGYLVPDGKRTTN
jgi:hypothetical protein